ncbi:MAG TPA: hypothetical protein VJ824_02075 [Bacillota bacterium]|nr:hypothetical protein [Bacillota bacterium]
MKPKQRKKRRGLRIFMAITVLQWGILLGVNLFLAPEPIVPAVAQNIFKEEEPAIKAPADADQFRISDDKKVVAYTKDKELFIANKDGVMYQKKVGRVTYFQWLGKSNSLLYFIQDSNLTGYIIQASTLKPHELESWKGTDRKIKQAYFNPYMEFLYFETERGKVDEIYKYDAVNGIYKFPFPDIKIDRINFDEKTDTMEIYDTTGKRWDYKNGQLYDPKGNLMELKRIKDPTPNEDSKKDDPKPESKSTEKTEPTGVPKETTTKETTKQSGTKTTDQNNTSTTKEPATTTTSPTKKDSTSGIEPPVVTQPSHQGTTTSPTKQTTPKDTVTPKSQE